MTALGPCRHCGVMTLSSSIGPIHTDTHNSRCAVGEHRAEPTYPNEGKPAMNIYRPTAGDIGEKRRHVEIPAEEPIKEPAVAPAEPAPAEPVPA